MARRGDESLVLYAASGRWMTRRVGASGAPLDAAPSEVGPIRGEVTVGTLRAVGDGYAVAWAELAGKNHALWTLSLDAKGQAMGPPLLVTQSPEELSYVEVLANAKGALVLWEVPREEQVDLFTVPLIAGKVATSPVTVVRDALGWEAVATARGAALAVVARDPARPASDEEPRLGRVEFMEVDAATARPSAPVVVSSLSTAQIDPQIVELGGRFLIAWTDERELDASVYVATIGAGGKDATPPRRATAPLGEQALVALVAEPTGQGKRALLAWEDLLRARPDGRPIHLATIGPDATVSDARATLLFSANGPPDLVVDGDGFAALTLAPAQLTTDGPPAKLNVLPAFVRFTKDLAVRASEPIRADVFATTEGIPYLTQSIGCGPTSCTLLASGTGDAAPLAAVVLPVRDNPWRSPAWRDAEEVPPTPTRITSIYDGDKLSHVASVETTTGLLTGWLTYVLEEDAAGVPGKSEPPGAVLSLRPIAKAGGLGESVEISKRAVSVGRLAMSTATTGKSETAVAWVGRSKDGPQVFVTKVDADGKKLAQKAVTVISRRSRGSASSQVSDVAIAYDGADAWTLAWVDTRDNNAEIYVAKVDRSLKKVVPDRRITTAPGDAAEVTLQVRGKDTFLAWSDARGDVAGGTGDIYVAKVDTRSLQKAGSEARLFASVAHSRSPVLTNTASGLGLAWLEEGSAGTATRTGEASAADAEAGVRIAWLDAEGRLLGAPFRVRPEQAGAVTSVAMRCDQTCRGVFTAGHGTGLSMSAFEVRPGTEAVSQRPIATLTGGLAEDVSPALPTPLADALFFADDALGGTSRVRWMTLRWR